MYCDFKRMKYNLEYFVLGSGASLAVFLSPLQQCLVLQTGTDSFVCVHAMAALLADSKCCGLRFLMPGVFLRRFPYLKPSPEPKPRSVSHLVLVLGLV